MEKFVLLGGAMRPGAPRHPRPDAEICGAEVSSYATSIFLESYSFGLDARDLYHFGPLLNVLGHKGAEVGG
jgi:hypothetical protein